MVSPTLSPAIAPPQDGASTRVPLRMSFEEFLARADEDEKTEWVDGELIVMAPASDGHQNLAGFLEALLRYFVEENGGWVRSNPFLMRLRNRPSGREPDVLFVAEENCGRITPTYLDGPADLVIEIVSPESRERDTKTKREEYEAGGVREFWLLDLENKSAEFLFLEDGKYRALPIEDGVFHSRVLAGLWLREEWLWQPPKLLHVLREWNLL